MRNLEDSKDVYLCSSVNCIYYSTQQDFAIKLFNNKTKSPRELTNFCSYLWDKIFSLELSMICSTRALLSSMKTKFNQ